MTGQLIVKYLISLNQFLFAFAEPDLSIVDVGGRVGEWFFDVSAVRVVEHHILERLRGVSQVD